MQQTEELQNKNEYELTCNCLHEPNETVIPEVSVGMGEIEESKGATNHENDSAITTKKHSSKNRNMKKEKNTEQHILRTLHEFKTPEEKLSALCRNYSEVLEENHVVQNALKQNQIKFQALQREKNQLQVDHSKAVLTRSRLESLCRELQKQNKAVQEDSIKKIKEEEEKRKEISQKFQSTLGEIHNLMDASNQKNSKLRDENQDLGKKLKSLLEQYDVREKHVEQVVRHREMQTELAEAKLAKSNLELATEKEQNLLEKKKLLEDLTEYQQKCQLYAGNEIKLRSELNMYVEKYEEFQSAFSKSNAVFNSFRAEMDKMTKKIKKLEVETASWKTKWENSHKALFKMAEDKQRVETSYLTAQKQVAQLDKLCRALQIDRTKLLQLLKEKQPNDSVAGTNNPDSVIGPDLTNELPSVSPERETVIVAAPERSPENPPNTPQEPSKVEVSAETSEPRLTELSKNVEEITLVENNAASSSDSK